MTKAGRTVLAWLMLVGCDGRPSAAESSGTESTTGASTGTSSDATGSGSGTSGTATSGTESESDGGWTLFPDLSEVPVLCDPFLQDCDEGEKCVPTAPSHEPAFEGPEAYEFKCVPVLGDQAPGEPCTSSGHQDGLDNCDETSSCWNLNEIDGELVGICNPMCTGNPDDGPECIEGYYCELWGQLGITLCVWNCDPLAQDCDPGMACYYDGLFSCFFPGDAPVNAPCGDIPQPCAEGLGCLSADVLPDCEAEACCSPICDTDLGDEQCAAVPGTSCVPLFVQPIPGYERVGFCLLP